MRWALLMGMLLWLPVAHAQPGPLAVDEVACAMPPCGYIEPLLDIVLEGKTPCGGARLIYATEPPTDCWRLPDDGASRQVNGSVRWYWKVSEEGTYPKEPGKDILITFSGASTNPPWLTFTVTGPDMVDGAFVIDDEALADDENYRTETDGDTPVVWFWFEREIEVTFARDGDPANDELRFIDARQGVVQTHVKAKSSESSTRFRESFGVEEVRFMGCGDDNVALRSKACPNPLSADRDVPVPGWTALAVLALARRR